jgi:RimJ/RimL family protein N-acetyltransferase
MDIVIPFITTERLFLEKCSPKHCTPTYLGWLHDPQVNNYLESGHFPVDLNQLIKYVSEKNGEEIFLAIIIKDGLKHIGNVRIHSINRQSGVAELGIMIGDRSEWGKGYAVESMTAMINHSFKILNIRKITAGAISGNEASLKMCLSLGFKIEGRLVDQCFVDGKYYDAIRMGMFQKDWINNGR